MCAGSVLETITSKHTVSSLAVFAVCCGGGQAAQAEGSALGPGGMFASSIPGKYTVSSLAAFAVCRGARCRRDVREVSYE